MATLSLTRLAVAVGGLALSLTTGAGAASADPDPIGHELLAVSPDVRPLALGILPQRFVWWYLGRRPETPRDNVLVITAVR